MKAVFDTRSDTAYDDDIVWRYHFPNTYLSEARKSVGDWIVYREPRRGGGRQAYVSVARVTRLEPDPARKGHSYAHVEGYGRVVALCRAGGEDLNAWKVEQGWALAHLRDEERAARAGHRGIWRGEFVPPWDWRGGERLVGAGYARTRDFQSASGDCLIKGNISRGGERIYHVPGGAFYESTLLEPAKGERRLCSEREARAAGWRKSKRGWLRARDAGEQRFAPRHYIGEIERLPLVASPQRRLCRAPGDRPARSRHSKSTDDRRRVRPRLSAAYRSSAYRQSSSWTMQSPVSFSSR